jgi:hypothetical protein
MRYIAYGLAILAAASVLAFTTGYLPRDATASHNNEPYYTAVSVGLDNELEPKNRS